MEGVASKIESLSDGSSGFIITDTGNVLRNLTSVSTVEGILLPCPSYISVPSSLISNTHYDDNEQDKLASLLRKWNLHEELFIFLKCKYKYFIEISTRIRF